VPRVNRLALRAALLPVGYSQGLGGGSYSFLLSFRARAFFIPLTFLNALLIPLGRVSPERTPGYARFWPAEPLGTTTMLAKNRQRKASGSPHSSPPAVSALRLSRWLLERTRAFSTFLPRPRRPRGAVREEGLLPFAREIRVLLLRFSLTRLSRVAGCSFPPPSFLVPVCLSLSPLSFSLPPLPFRPPVSFLFCVL